MCDGTHSLIDFLLQTIISTALQVAILLARPRSMRSAEITPYKADLPVLNAPGVRFVIGSLPLTDGARPSRDVKRIVARSADGRIQNYSRGGHHDSNQCYTTRHRAGRCNSSV